MNKNREQIIIENFFKLLEERKISQSEYAKATNIDRTLISKWKNGQSKMTIEHINTAIEYFQISLDDLYYEQKEHIEKNNTADFKTSVKRKYKINDISYISNFKENILFSLTFAITLTIIIILLQSHSIHFIYLIFITIITIFSYSNKDDELPYIIINNEDKIYYKSDIKDNKYFNRLYKLYITNMIALSLITLLSFVLLFIYKEQKAIIITYFIVNIIMLLILMISKPLKTYKNIKNIELSNYMNVRMYFVLCST